MDFLCLPQQMTETGVKEECCDEKIFKFKYGGDNLKFFTQLWPY